MRNVMIAALAACAVGTLTPGVAQAAPGLGDEVYDATTTKGELELEARLGELAGGPDGGENAAKLEVTYSPTDRLRVATLLELERDKGGPRKAEAAAVEAIYTVGRFAGIDVAVYGEYEVGLQRDTSDAVEGKLILQRKAGPIDARLNLIFEKHLAAGEKVEVGYAASADYAVLGDELRLGVEAYGELGTFHHFAPRAEHFVGPIVKTEIEGLGPDIEIEAGYLFAIDKARADTKGQVKLQLEVEF